jgi:hypothetical protein
MTLGITAPVMYNILRAPTEVAVEDSILTNFKKPRRWNNNLSDGRT